MISDAVAEIQNVGITCVIIIPLRNTRNYQTVSDDSKMIDQWPLGLKHELSSSARTLVSWARIPLEVWMFAFILFR
jgi:hypothetical protein